MEDPPGRRRLRGFLSSRMHKHKRQSPDPEEILSASNTSSHSSQPEYGAVLMEGNLKKRLAKMPVMHERYCVATWHHDVDEHKYIMLRSYKSRKAYDAHPEKPSGVHKLKRISNWDGKTGFHRYQHAFTMEMRDKKLYQCIAPSATDKSKWLELMASPLAFKRGRGKRVGSDSGLERRRRAASASAADGRKPRAYTDALATPTNLEDQNDFPVQDQLFRATLGASIDSRELRNGDNNEPDDWGLYGEESELASSKYEVDEDLKPVLLDKELLDTHGEAKTLDSDNFLFDETSASRFGAVIVKNSNTDDDQEDAEFVDEEFVAREAQKEKEKKKKRWAQKLESNRDLYAEMAAARLAGMRKDARHPKKRYDHSYGRSSVGSEENSDVEIHDDIDIQSMVEDGEAEIVPLEDVNQRRSSSHSRRSSKSHKKSSLGSETASIVNDGYAQGKLEDDEEEEEYTSPTADCSSQLAAAEVTETESIEDKLPLAENEELRLLKKKYRAERRAKKQLMREKEEEERTAREAAELARAHREEQRAREEAKVREEQEKRMKQERRMLKDKLKREKLKQRQAEAELEKLAKMKQEEEERRERERKEKKEKKTKSKKKKYTSPTDRIHRKDEREVERAVEVSPAVKLAEPEVSNALVVVEKMVDKEPAPQLLEAPEPAPISVPSSTSSSVQTEHSLAQETVKSCATSAVPGSNPAPVATPPPAFAPDNGTTSPQAMPMSMYQMYPPPFMPSYPTGSPSMPAYGLAATFGAFPPFYVAPYSYGGPVGMQPTLMRPNVGYVTGLSAMQSFGPPAGPAPSPSSLDSAEPMIGPQLPSPEGRAAVSSLGTSAPSLERMSLDKLAGPKLLNLPELPDVVEF